MHPSTCSFLIIYLFLLLFLNSCKALKTKAWLKSGEVIQQNFLAEVSFENRMDYVIVPIQIQGEFYDFLLDTGAPNVISQEIFETLELKTVFK